MADEVFTTGNANVQAFTAAVQHARSRGDAAEAERALNEADRLARPAQIAAQLAPAIKTAQDAANLATQRAGIIGSVANDAALAGKPAGDYRAGREIVTWSGSAVTTRTVELASAAEVATAQTLAQGASDTAATLGRAVQVRRSDLTAAFNAGSATRLMDEHGPLRVRDKLPQDVIDGGVRFALAGNKLAERETDRTSVKMFNAKGDGADDTTAFLATFAYAKAKVSGTQILAVIEIPVGYYRYTQTLIQDFRCVIRGEYGMGNATTLLYDPPQSVVDACVAGTTDPMSVPAILATGTRTGGATHPTLANGLKNGGDAALLYGCTLEGIQLSTTVQNYGKLDGLVLRDVSEYDYQHLNINGQFRNGIVYWGANLVYALRCNVSNNKVNFTTRPANATNWQVSAVVALHHHMNIWNSETNWKLDGFVRHLHVTDSWQEWSKNHILIQPAADAGAQIITDVVFSGVQFVSKTAEDGAFDERLLRIDLSALTTQRVQIAGLAFNNCWGFFPNSGEIITLKRGAAVNVRVEPITLGNTEWYGLFAAQYLIHAEDMLPFNESWKFRIVGGVLARKHWDAPIDPVVSLTSNINAMLLGWRWTTGEGHSITTTADGYMTMRGQATLNFGGQASVMEGVISHPRITSPQVTGLCLRGEPTMTAKAGAWYTKTLHLTSLFHALSQFTLVAYSNAEFAAGNSVTAQFEVSGVLA